MFARCSPLWFTLISHSDFSWKLRGSFSIQTWKEKIFSVEQMFTTKELLYNCNYNTNWNWHILKYSNSKTFSQTVTLSRIIASPSCCDTSLVQNLFGHIFFKSIILATTMIKRCLFLLISLKFERYLFWDGFEMTQLRKVPSNIKEKKL